VSQVVVVALVLVAAVLHASWNAIVKHSGERLLTFAIVIGAGAVLYLPVTLLLPHPGPASFGYLLGSALIHLLYYACLLLGYHYGDLGQVYPIARGTGPLVVALCSAPLAGERLGPVASAGVALVSLGIVALAGRGKERSRRAVGFALATGVCIGAYSLCDGLGVRVAQNKLGYLAWLHVCIGIPFAGGVLLVRRRRIGAFFRSHGGRAVAGGVIATIAYSIAVFAMSQTTLAYVASLRETSVVFAAALGTWALREPFGRRRMVAAVAVACGVVLATVGRAG